MKTIKLIDIDDDGLVQLTGKNMDKYVTGRDAAVQRFVIALMNTPGTMVDDPTWGGGIKEVFLSTEYSEDKKLRTEVGEKIQNTLESLGKSRQQLEDYSIVDATLKNFERLDRGFSADIVLEFFNASSKRIQLGQDVT